MESWSHHENQHRHRRLLIIFMASFLWAGPFSAPCHGRPAAQVRGMEPAWRRQRQQLGLQHSPMFVRAVEQGLETEIASTTGRNIYHLAQCRLGPKLGAVCALGTSVIIS